MYKSKPILTAQEALRSMNEMREMSKILTSSTKSLENMWSNVKNVKDGEVGSHLKSNADAADDGEDSDFSTSLINELSNKSIDEELNNMVQRHQQQKKVKVKSPVRPTRNAISRIDMAVLLFFLFRKCKGEVEAKEVLRKHRNTENYKKKILQLSRSKSIENPVRTISQELRLIVSRAEKFLIEKCKLDLIAEELFRIIYNILTKYECKQYTLQTKHTLIEAKKFLTSSRPNWKPTDYFAKVLSMYKV
ncbi:unnamed protein product [Auanema sp. JU1783]|nr:unnamed protein product [Auanema sp. JU1783]